MLLLTVMSNLFHTSDSPCCKEELVLLEIISSSDNSSLHSFWLTDFHLMVTEHGKAAVFHVLVKSNKINDLLKWNWPNQARGNKEKPINQVLKFFRFMYFWCGDHFKRNFLFLENNLVMLISQNNVLVFMKKKSWPYECSGYKWKEMLLEKNKLVSAAKWTEKRGPISLETTEAKKIWRLEGHCWLTVSNTFK